MLEVQNTKAERSWYIFWQLLSPFLLRSNPWANQHRPESHWAPANPNQGLPASHVSQKTRDLTRRIAAALGSALSYVFAIRVCPMGGHPRIQRSFSQFTCTFNQSMAFLSGIPWYTSFCRQSSPNSGKVWEETLRPQETRRPGGVYRPGGDERASGGRLGL